MREQQNEEITVTLTLDNDEVLECAVLTIYEAGGRQYIALLPQDENGEEEGDVYIYRYIETDPENPDLENIEDDEEYEIAADAFDEWLGGEGFRGGPAGRQRKKIWTPSRRPSSFFGEAEAPPRTGKDPRPFRFLSSRR
mgnify:CR=1 FL=1